MPSHDYGIPRLEWEKLPEQSEAELRQATYDQLTHRRPIDEQPTEQEIIDTMEATRTQLLADRTERKQKATDEIITILTRPAQDLGETL